jgi:hypothetical protein
MSIRELSRKHPRIYNQVLKRGIDATIKAYSNRYIITPKPEDQITGPRVTPEQAARYTKGIEFWVNRSSSSAVINAMPPLIEAVAIRPRRM